MSFALPLFGMEPTAKTSDDFYTPAWVFERMGIEFDLDVAAPPGGLPWIPTKRYFTKADDGLAQPWAGRVWMNPPYSAQPPRRVIFVGGDGDVSLPTFFAAFGDECVEAISRLGVVRKVAS